MEEIEGPHLLPQPEQRRVAAPGRRLDGRGGATLIAIWCPLRDSWVLYLDSDPKQAIVLGIDEVARLVQQLGGQRAKD